MMELLLQPEPEIEKKKYGNVCAQRVKRQWKRKARYPGLDQNPPIPPKKPTPPCDPAPDILKNLIHVPTPPLWANI